ncbi:hypothetical protein Ae406Ps2_3014c [Pseudonocardia sp. Ae406_Ps2]|nr:hypothetical protein Ae331Ps2_2913 [Pseudonocardia sp. Ae331_Ps2]OLM03014.1 hypothetical protein Ae406Ps2_3014c [Pseudonocardia sp. Ae406_Ps2]OLM12132.1 hypothetical protein Ae505Ps2_2259 [Pseudonocardia sp. Ae505_Ps2]
MKARTVAAALDAGVRRDVLAVAAHEVGHGLAWAHAGFAAGPARVETGLFGGPCGASCKHGASGRLNESNVVGFLIGCAAGRAGQHLFTARYLGGRDVGATGDDAARDRGDFDYSERYYRTGLSWAAAQRHATALLRPRLARVERLAVRLAVTGRLSRTDFR